MKKGIVLFLTLLFLPFCTQAQVAQIVFTTDAQTIGPNEISGQMTVQTQDSSGISYQTNETIDLVFTSTSPTGEFLSPSSENTVTTTMANGTANKNFRYRDATEGTFSVTVNATGRTSGNSWNASQDIIVETLTPILPTVNVSGTLATSTVWSAGSVYVLQNVVVVPVGTTLTIEPGAIIKGKNGGAGLLQVEGALLANGTEAQPIYFTSYFDDEVGGDSDGIEPAILPANKDWRGIYFGASSTGVINHAVVRYAGYNGIGTQSGIENDGGTVSIANSVVSNNYLRGINNRGGSVTITGSIIENHSYGLFATAGEMSVQNSTIRNNSVSGIDALGVNTLTLTNNSFSDNQKTGRVDASANFSHNGNSSADLTNRGFEVSGIVASNVTWSSGDLPLIVPAGSVIWVSASGTLAINPSSVIKFGSAGQMIVQGRLVSGGAENTKIHFTSLKDDSVGGDTNNDSATSSPVMMDWNGIEFQDGSNGELSYTNIRYTGGFNGVSRAAVFNLGATLSLNNLEFSQNFLNDIYHTTGSTTVSRSQFSTTTSYAVFNAGSSTLDARNNWWGVGTGPTHSSNATGTGRVVSDHVLFSPWLGRDPVLPNPVIIVPGIMATELIEDNVVGSLIWPNTIQLATSVTDDFLNVLEMNENGYALNNILTGDVIRSLNNADYFNGLFGQLTSNDYLENSDLFEFPYDWRLDIETSAQKLKEKIDKVKLQTGAEEIDLVAHSMGGLLVKKYLKDYGGNSVEKFVDIGTPHTGASPAYKILMHGDSLGVEKFFGLISINSSRIKEISQNMLAVYQLLPSREYFGSDTDYYVLDGTNGNDRLTFDETQNYLKAAGRNAGLVERADVFHQEIDNLNPADYGVETYNIIGCGIPTIGQFYILEEGSHPVYNIRMINGDGTVPLKSAEGVSANTTYYVEGVAHALLPSATGVRELIVSILTEDNSFNLSSYSNLSLSSDGCSIPNGRLVSFHSPIELHVYDSSGNHVGPNEGGDIENEISGVVYEVIDDNKFAFLPDGTNYTIKGSATDAGMFDVRIQEVVSGEVSTTTLFMDIPLTAITQAQFDLTVTVPTQIYLDSQNDGIFESSSSVSTTSAGILESTGHSTQPLFLPESEFSVDRLSGSSGSTDIKPAIVTKVETVAIGEGSREVSGIYPKTVKRIEVVQRSTSTPKTPEYRNTATVYKSFGQKVSNFLKKLWFSITSKL